MEQDSVITYMMFFLNGKQFVLETERVLEVLEMPFVTPVPKGPSYMLGVFNWKGKVVSLMDVSEKLGLGKAEVGKDHEVIVIGNIIDGSLVRVGIAVDKIRQVIEIKESAMQPLHEETDEQLKRIAKGAFDRKGDTVYYLEIDKIFHNDDHE